MKSFFHLISTFLLVLMSLNSYSLVYPKETRYLCTGFNPSMELYAYVTSPNRFYIEIKSQDLYPGFGNSMHLTASVESDSPQSPNIIFSAYDARYDYSFPFPKSEFENPTMNFFNMDLKYHPTGTFDNYVVYLRCSQII